LFPLVSCIQISDTASPSLLGSPFFHSLFGGKLTYRRGASYLSRQLVNPGLYNLPGNLELRQNHVRRFGVELRRSGKSRLMSAAVIAAKNYALTMQMHSRTVIRQLWEHDLHLDQCSNRRHCVRLDVYPESVDVTSNAPAAVRRTTLWRPHEERRSAQLVAFGLSQFNGIVHVLVAFTESAPGLRRID